MKLTYDGLETSGFVTFTNVPNIVSIESDSSTGSKATLKITIGDLSSLDLDKEYTVTVNNKTITSTTGVAVNRRFHITNLNGQGARESVACSITKALRNSGLASYSIYLQNEIVYVVAKEVGSIYNITFVSSLPNVSYNILEGSSTDEFIGGKMNIDVYSNKDYVTTLEKNYYKDSIGFNVSEVLESISRYDFLTPYKLKIYFESLNSIRNLGEITGKSAIGYMCNQGNNFIKDLPALALNVGRGSLLGVLNKTVLYVYIPSIPLTVYSNNASENVVIKYLNSAKEVIKTTDFVLNIYNGIGKADLALETIYFDLAHYIDIEIDTIGVLRYNVIKPLDANSGCKRIYYHNSYGGVSFFDFTGGKTENHKVDNSTYTKNLYDFYKDSDLELVKIYDKKPSITVTVKSHLMEKSAIWQFNDLLGSYDAWADVNGKDYKIIITDCKVDETETGVWEAVVTYTYSLV